MLDSLEKKYVMVRGKRIPPTQRKRAIAAFDASAGRPAKVARHE